MKRGLIIFILITTTCVHGLQTPSIGKGHWYHFDEEFITQIWTNNASSPVESRETNRITITFDKFTDNEVKYEIDGKSASTRFDLIGCIFTSPDWVHWQESLNTGPQDLCELDSTGNFDYAYSQNEAHFSLNYNSSSIDSTDSVYSETTLHYSKVSGIRAYQILQTISIDLVTDEIVNTTYVQTQGETAVDDYAAGPLPLPFFQIIIALSLFSAKRVKFRG